MATGRVNERTSSRYTAQLVDEAGDNVALSSIATLTLTLYDKVSDQIINSREDQDIKNHNNVTVSSTGFITWILQPDDNIIVDPTCDTELHIALFKGTYGVGGTKDINHLFSIRVVNMHRVP